MTTFFAFAQQGAGPVPIARKALDLLLSGQYHELRALFNKQMLDAVTEDMLARQIGAQIKAWGNAGKIGDPVVQHVQNVDAVIFPVHFTNNDIKVILPIDADGKLAGLRFAPGEKPAKQEESWTPPPYVKPEAFRDRDVTVGGGEWKLPGTLSLPVGSGPSPAVVLVHGSGPNDRDETVGANKPFRDIAEGLASRGVAVLRYEKRTRVYAQQMASLKDLTVEQESIADALEALEFLRTQHEIDAKRIFLLGHSLGGYLGPRIAERDLRLSGLIIMAGNTRPMPVLIIDQAIYVKADPKVLEKLNQQAAEIRELKSAAGPPILGVPRSYWLDLNAYDPKAEVRKLHCPILVLQGERDYQVTKPDYSGWQNSLAGDKNATFHLYPALNHLFVAGEGRSMPAEYDKAGHVAPEVIGDIASWIKS